VKTTPALDIHITTARYRSRCPNCASSIAQHAPIARLSRGETFVCEACLVAFLDETPLAVTSAVASVRSRRAVEPEIVADIRMRRAIDADPATYVVEADGSALSWYMVMPQGEIPRLAPHTVGAYVPVEGAGYAWVECYRLPVEDVG
jgi:hypothetical protein